MSNSTIFSSFRDPSGFVFQCNGEIFRQINAIYAPVYSHAADSGLFEKLVSTGKLLPFTELKREEWPSSADPQAHAIIQPQILPFISYPYEWSFNQLKDAALLTLDIQIEALDSGMILKDASAYNIQFIGSRPVFIDHLSFDMPEKYPAWPGYGQFCQHFLAPLALISKKNIPAEKLLRPYIDGIPLDLAAKLLPFSSKFSPGLFMHIFMHAKLQKKYADSQNESNTSRRLNINQLKSIALLMRGTIEKMKWESVGKTEWGDYYEDTNYTPTAMQAKQRAVQELALKVNPAKLLDIGGNDGTMLRLASPKGAYAVCCDIDPVAVDRCYLSEKKAKGSALLPLLQDLTNPSPSLGFASQERDSFGVRCNQKMDLVLALALVHHLAISNNLPLPYIADYIRSLAKFAIVEFIPKEDSQVKRLLSTREDIFPTYTEEGFEQAFFDKFTLLEKRQIPESHRSLYLFEVKPLD